MIKKISIILAMCILFSTVVFAGETQNYIWSGYYKEDVEFPEESGNKTTEIKLGPIAARQSATLGSLPSVSGNYKLSYDIYFNSDISTSSDKYYYFPKITSSDGEYAAIYIEGDKVYFDVNGKKVLISLTKEKWLKFSYIFYPSQKLVSLTINDGTTENIVKDENANTLFEMKCTSLDSLYFYRETPGSAIVAYFDNPVIETFISVSLKSNVYNVDNDNFLIKGVLRETSVDEFFKNIVVTDASCKLFEKNGTQKTSGLMTDGDYVVLDDGTTQYTYTVIMSGYTVDSDLYNVDNTELVIRGISENTKKSEFIANLNITGGETPVVSDESGILSDDDTIYNGCEFYITDGEKSSKYKLITDKAEDYVYFYDNYEDNSKGGWNIGTVKEDGNGNSYLSFDLSTAYTTTKKVENARVSDLVVSEFDIFYPALSDYSSAIRGIYFNTPEDKIIMSLRTDTSGNLVALDGFSATTIYNGIVGSWHKIRMIADNTSETFDVYVDSKGVDTDLDYQAESNLKPNIVKFGFDKGESGELKIDNFTIYEPYPILMSKLSFVNGQAESFNVNSVRNDVEKIKVYFSTREGIEIKQDSIVGNIGLYDDKNNEIKTTGSFDSTLNIYTLNVDEILDESIRYTVKVKNIKDDYYGKNYSAQIGFTSKNSDVKIVSGDLSFDGSNVNVNAQIKNFTSDIIDVDMIATAIGTDGRIIGVKSIKLDNMNGYSSPDISCYINTGDKTSDVKMVKIYVRQRNSSPLCVDYTIER